MRLNDAIGSDHASFSKCRFRARGLNDTLLFPGRLVLREKLPSTGKTGHGGSQLEAAETSKTVVNRKGLTMSKLEFSEFRIYKFLSRLPLSVSGSESRLGESNDKCEIKQPEGWLLWNSSGNGIIIDCYFIFIRVTSFSVSVILFSFHSGGARSDSARFESAVSIDMYLPGSDPLVGWIWPFREQHFRGTLAQRTAYDSEAYSPMWFDMPASRHIRRTHLVFYVPQIKLPFVLSRVVPRDIEHVAGRWTSPCSAPGWSSLRADVLFLCLHGIEDCLRISLQILLLKLVVKVNRDVSQGNWT